MRLSYVCRTAEMNHVIRQGPKMSNHWPQNHTGLMVPANRQPVMNIPSTHVQESSDAFAGHVTRSQQHQQAVYPERSHNGNGGNGRQAAWANYYAAVASKIRAFQQLAPRRPSPLVAHRHNNDAAGTYRCTCPKSGRIKSVALIQQRNSATAAGRKARNKAGNSVRSTGAFYTGRRRARRKGKNRSKGSKLCDNNSKKKKKENPGKAGGSRKTRNRKRRNHKRGKHAKHSATTR